MLLDARTRSNDAALPNLNSPLVEYELLLQDYAVKKLGLHEPSITQIPTSNRRILPSRPSPSAPNRASSGTSTPPTRANSNSRALKRRAESGSDHGRTECLRAIRPRVEVVSPLLEPGNGLMDPFSALPVQEPRFEMRVHQLLQMYLDGQILSDMRFGTAVIIRDSVVGVRREKSFAQMMKSSAAFNALIAYIETSPDPQILTQNDGSVKWHISQALTLTNAQLAHPQLLDSDGVIVTVLLLMLIAARMNDTSTFHAHAQGLKILCHRRRIDRLQSQHPSPTYLPTPISPAFPGAQVQPGWDDVLSPNAFPGKVTEPSIPPADAGYSTVVFAELVAKGLVSAKFAETHHYSSILNQLAAYARFDWTLALVAAQHIWTDGGEPVWSNLEMACQGTLRMVMHMNVWPVTSAPCLVALNRAAAMKWYLLEINLDMLFFQCPKVLVWISLTVGPLSVGYARRWFAYVLKKAQSLSYLRSFGEAQAMCEQEYAWSPAMTLAAEVFWTATIYPTSFKTEPAPGQDAPHWGLAKRLRNEAKVDPVMNAAGPWTGKPTTSDVMDAEDSLMATVAENAMCSRSEDGSERWSVVIAPSPPCLLNQHCPAHGVHLVGSMAPPG